MTAWSGEWSVSDQGNESEEERGAEYRMKRIGPRTELCGTPKETSTGLELRLLTVTVGVYQ